MPRRASDDGEERDALVGALVNDFVDRRARGETVSEAELLVAHPDLAGELRDALELLGDLGALPGRIERLLRLGVLSPIDDARYRGELGSWKIIDELGAGGMGVVLLADEPELERRVAIKFLKPELADDLECRRRFLSEARAAAKLKHPNVIEIHAVGEAAGVPYFVMEYVEGPSLAEVIRNSYPPSAVRNQPSASSHQSDDHGAADPRVGGGPSGRDAPASDSFETRAAAKGQSKHAAQANGFHTFILSTTNIREIFRQLLEALAAAHEKGLIHRDVKPANILLELQGDQATRQAGVEKEESFSDAEPVFRVKLADFGLARSLASQTRVTAPDKLLGTPEYMSPEQARGDAGVDHRTDLYSAGVVLYEMLTGRVPFRAETPSGVIQRIMVEPPTAPRVINAAADPVLAETALRLVEKDQTSRFQGSNEILAFLKTGRVSAVARLTRRLGRKRIRVYAFGTLALLGFGILAVLLLPAPRLIRLAVDANDPRRLQGEWNYGFQWNIVTFPGTTGEIRKHALIDTQPDKAQTVLVGLWRREAGDNVYAYDAFGNLRWSNNFADVLPDSHWPDCVPSELWICGKILPFDGSGDGASRILIDVRHFKEYPCRLSLVDVNSGESLTAFWHMGNLEGYLILENFFEGGRPGLLVWGENNKFDGFDDRVTADGDDPPRTKHDIVSVAMILDPEDMDGLGPPRTSRVGIPPARPYAYVLLDMAISRKALVTVPDTQGYDPLIANEVGSIDDIELALTPSNPTSQSSFLVTVSRGEDKGGGALLVVDRQFNLLSISKQTGEGERSDFEYWQARWRPVIRAGRYLPIESRD